MLKTGKNRSLGALTTYRQPCCMLIMRVMRILRVLGQLGRARMLKTGVWQSRGPADYEDYEEVGSRSSDSLWQIGLKSLMRFWEVRSDPWVHDGKWDWNPRFDFGKEGGMA